MDNTQSERFLRQLLLYRYQQLLQRIIKVYNPSETQIAEMEKKILHINWIDDAFKMPDPIENTDEDDC